MVPHTAPRTAHFLVLGRPSGHCDTPYLPCLSYSRDTKNRPKVRIAEARIPDRRMNKPDRLDQHGVTITQDVVDRVAHSADFKWKIYVEQIFKFTFLFTTSFLCSKFDFFRYLVAPNYAILN